MPALPLPALMWGVDVLAWLRWHVAERVAGVERAARYRGNAPVGRCPARRELAPVPDVR